LVLSLVEPRAIIAHVVHDIRGDGTAIADRDAVERLAGVLGCRFEERRVLVKEMAGNLEDNARRARYDALCEIAEGAGSGLIVTGHHADDQLETLLMRLMRGTGVRGMGGVSPTRKMGSMRIVRPMLGVTRDEIEGLCRDAGLGWQHDHTNDDLGYLRNRIRHEVVPVLVKIEPQIATRISGLAEDCREMSEFVGRRVREGVAGDARRDGDRWSWTRDAIRREPSVMIGELIFVYIREVLGGVGADSISRRAIDSLVVAIKSDDTDPCVHRVGPIVVDVRAGSVDISVARKDPSEQGREERSCDE